MTDELKKELKEVTQELRGKYGDEVQIDIAIEEMSELTKAVLKYRRYYKKRDIDGIFDYDAARRLLLDIYEEIADVEIMIFQLREIYCGVRVGVDAIQKRKIARIKEEVLKK